MKYHNPFMSTHNSELMNEPVIDREGNTYEKASIMDYIKRKHDFTSDSAFESR